MQLRKINIGNGPYANANMACYDPSNNHIVYLSIIGYDGTIKVITKEINKKNSVYIERMGSFSTVSKSYEIIKAKDQESGYSHAVIYKKDEVYENNSKEEVLNAYVFVELADDFRISETVYNNADIPQQLLDRIYDKIYAHTPVPVIPEWMDFITRSLVNAGCIRELRAFKPDGIDFKVYKLNVKFSTLFNIVSRGLSERIISINNTYTPSEEMQAVTGLDSYLNTFTPILTQIIQDSFTPKFIPGQDKYSERLQDFDDYATYKGLSMYEAQKAVVQATANNLDKNNVSFIIGEMGVGRFIAVLSGNI